MRRDEIEIRWAAIPEPMRRLGATNATLHAVLTKYAHGHIVIWEEALCQAVIALAADRSALLEDCIQARQHGVSTIPAGRHLPAGGGTKSPG